MCLLKQILYCVGWFLGLFLAFPRRNVVTVVRLKLRIFINVFNLHGIYQNLLFKFASDQCIHSSFAFDLDLVELDLFLNLLVNRWRWRIEAAAHDIFKHLNRNQVLPHVQFTTFQCFFKNFFVLFRHLFQYLKLFLLFYHFSIFSLIWPLSWRRILLRIFLWKNFFHFLWLTGGFYSWSRRVIGTLPILHILILSHIVLTLRPSIILVLEPERRKWRQLFIVEVSVRP